MSDLISRSELINAMNTWDKFGCNEHGRLVRLDSTNNEEYVPYVHYEDMVNCVKNMPTAYSVDKVVEELERIRAKETCNKEKCDTKEICRICVVDDAIEIVKHDGVSDDVCEWKSANDGEFIQNPHTKRLYSNEPSMQNVYCNTCGKKIKIVGD